MPAVLVAYASRNGNARKIAGMIASGVSKAGEEAVLVELGKGDASAEGYEMVFLGAEIGLRGMDARLSAFVEKSDFRGKKVALFCSYRHSKKPLEELAKKIEGKGGSIVNTLSFREKGWKAFIGGGALPEEADFRCEAFGEKAVNTAFRKRIQQQSFKTQIRNYRK